MLFRLHIRTGLPHDLQRAGFCFVQQGLEFDGVPFSRFDCLVRHTHQSEPDVHEFRRVADHFANLENLSKMELLTLISYIDNSLGLEFLNAVLHRREVGCGIVKGAVAFLHDADWHFDVLEENDRCPFARDGQTPFPETIDQGLKLIVVVAFASYEIKGYPQTSVDEFDFFNAKRDEPFPQRPVFRITGLQLHKFFATLGFPLLVVLASPVAFNVHSLQFLQGVSRHRLFIAEMAIAHDRNTELRTPIAEMIV